MFGLLAMDYLSFLYKNLAIRENFPYVRFRVFPVQQQNVVIKSNLVSTFWCLVTICMITPFYSLVFIRIHEILIHSQFQLYFAKNEVKYQDIDGNEVFTYPPILLFLNIFLLPIL